MALFGIMISTIGIDRSVRVDRFTFGLPDLRDGFFLPCCWPWPPLPSQRS